MIVAFCQNHPAYLNRYLDLPTTRASRFNYGIDFFGSHLRFRNCRRHPPVDTLLKKYAFTGKKFMEIIFVGQ
jgi:hypothetical protein